jgi:hypothetical protein
MDRYIAKANIEHFRQKLAQERDAATRETLKRLLAEEEAKLVALESKSKESAPKR